jgi:hypothetical protein
MVGSNKGILDHMDRKSRCNNPSGLIHIHNHKDPRLVNTVGSYHCMARDIDAVVYNTLVDSCEDLVGVVVRNILVDNCENLAETAALHSILGDTCEDLVGNAVAVALRNNSCGEVWNRTVLSSTIHRVNEIFVDKWRRK